VFGVKRSFVASYERFDREFTPWRSYFDFVLTLEEFSDGKTSHTPLVEREAPSGPRHPSIGDRCRHGDAMRLQANAPIGRYPNRGVKNPVATRQSWR
jgi:hypothetical protein